MSLEAWTVADNSEFFHLLSLNSWKKFEKQNFSHRKFENNYLYFSDLPPSQGGKYTGFGNCANPPPRSMSTNDFYDASVNGLTNVGLILGQNVISNLKNISFKKNPDLNFFFW